MEKSAFFVVDKDFNCDILKKSREKIMNEREMMKLAESMEEFSMSDFTVQDLENMRTSKASYDKYKQKYFDYYDDVKISVHEDW